MSQQITLAFIDASKSRQLYTAYADKTISIGSSSSSSIQQSHPYVAANHCKIRFSGSYQRWIVEDQGSPNGTYLNGERISKARVLSNNDRIRLGVDGPILSVGIKIDAQSPHSMTKTLHNIYEQPTASPTPSQDPKQSPALPLGLLVIVTIGAVAAIAFTRSQTPAVVAPQATPAPKDDTPASVCSGTSFEADEIYTRLLPTVVRITTATESGTGTGSGVVIESNSSGSKILTNYHVVEGSDQVTLIFPDNSSSTGTVMKTGGDQYLKDDLALVSTSRAGLLFASFSTDLKVGQNVFVLGSPALGEDTDAVLQWSLTKGIVSNVDPAGEPGIFQTDAGINPGNSGGPIFNSQGCIVGLAVAVPSDRTVQQVGFAISSDSINAFLAR